MGEGGEQEGEWRVERVGGGFADACIISELSSTWFMLHDTYCYNYHYYYYGWFLFYGSCSSQWVRVESRRESGESWRRLC